MSDQNNAPARGWLPVLDAGRRFRTDDAEQNKGSSPVEENQACASEPTGTRERERGREQDWASAIAAQFGLSSPFASESASVQSALTEIVPVEEEETIETLRDRLAYYEHFDSLIRDNVARSAELFKAVFSEREKSRTDLTQAASSPDEVAHQVEERIYAERQHTQHILRSLMDEATYLQQRADSLIQRLAEAITEMSTYFAEEDEPVSGA